MEPKELYDHLTSLEIDLQRSRAVTLRELSDHYRKYVAELTRHHVAEIEAIEARYARMLQRVRQARHGSRLLSLRLSSSGTNVVSD